MAKQAPGYKGGQIGKTKKEKRADKIRSVLTKYNDPKSKKKRMKKMRDEAERERGVTERSVKRENRGVKGKASRAGVRAYGEGINAAGTIIDRVIGYNKEEIEKRNLKIKKDAEEFLRRGKKRDLETDENVKKAKKRLMEKKKAKRPKPIPLPRRSAPKRPRPYPIPKPRKSVKRKK